ncbi:MAG TPA: DUF4019 domain-containing protein [Usitatibacter sp.]|nr:DUF4019 domain-containing protein [Usitatibacter sp.]
MQRRNFLVMAAVAGAALLPAAAEDVIDTGPATVAAQTWLATVDAGRYEQSWDDAAAYFREKISKEKWEDALRKSRAPLGGVLSRKVRTAAYARDLPNAPPGDYVVAQLDTRFENRPLAEEMVTAMREADGTWKVAGYFIR